MRTAGCESCGYQGVVIDIDSKMEWIEMLQLRLIVEMKCDYD